MPQQPSPMRRRSETWPRRDRSSDLRRQWWRRDGQMSARGVPRGDRGQGRDVGRFGGM